MLLKAGERGSRRFSWKLVNLSRGGGRSIRQRSKLESKADPPQVLEACVDSARSASEKGLWALRSSDPLPTSGMVSGAAF